MLTHPQHDRAAPPTITIAGAAPDTGNLGVQALGLVTLQMLHRRFPDARLVMLRGEPGRASRIVRVGNDTIPVEELGCSLSRRPFKPGNLRREAVLGRLGFGARAGSVSETISQSSCVLDISGGDSFTSMYGRYRFEYVMATKLATLRTGTPLILLPQTYGPFEEWSRGEVSNVLQRAAGVWARDENSRNIAESMMNGRSVGICPDLAFALPPDANVVNPTCDHSRIGFNVSGLLYERAQEFGIRTSYVDLVNRTVSALLRADHTAEVIFVPHVDPPNGTVSDAAAAALVRDQLPATIRDRCSVLETPASAPIAKAIISGFDFFVGSRMHACIAGLSSKVPTCGIVYSDKTAGVFATVGQDRQVLDPRTSSPAEVESGVCDAYARRGEIKATLETNVPRAVAAIDVAFDAMLTNTHQERRAA